MKTIFHKTEHFTYRQWDRGIDDSVMDEITCEMTPQPSKSVFIVGTDKLKQFGAVVKPKTNLVIVAKGKALITLFYVNDLFAYLKSKVGKINAIIL